MRRARARVEANKGAAGADGMPVDTSPSCLKQHWPRIKVDVDAYELVSPLDQLHRLLMCDLNRPCLRRLLSPTLALRRVHYRNDTLPDRVRQTVPFLHDERQVGWERLSRYAPVMFLLCFCCVFGASGLWRCNVAIRSVLDTGAIRIPLVLSDLRHMQTGTRLLASCAGLFASGGGGGNRTRVP